MHTFCFYGSALALVLMIGTALSIKSNPSLALVFIIAALCLFAPISVWTVWKGKW